VDDAKRVLIAAAVNWDDLWGLAQEGQIPCTDLLAFAANQDLADLFGVELGEDTETAALQMADVSGLAFGYAERAVLVAEVPASNCCPAWRGNPPGAVLTSLLPIGDCLAFFTGDTAATAIEDAKGLYADDAWDLPSVQKLLADQPLEWHDISELEPWLASQSGNHNDDKDDGAGHLADADPLGLGARP